jgi:two-component system cell cycle sensor histidine kinase/response regulator CckA
MDLPEDQNFSGNIEDMKASAHRMVHLTKQLLAYARGGRYHLQITPIRDFLENTLTLVEHTLKPSVRLETDFPLDLMQVKADRTQMQMVISAIVANANEAIEKDGRIRVSARNVELDEASCKGSMQPGPYVRVTVTDDGKGMDEETQNRIFEPFFTTHFIGRGLGMAAVYGIISNHEGSITVESRPGEGTRVQMNLPAMGEPTPAVEDRPPEKATGQGEGTVLVIEDEPDVMEITSETLKRLGYAVIEATTGKEAVQKALSSGPIDVALLDIKLPDMSGAQVYPLIMEARPELKVIVFSGYALDGPAREILDAGANGFIQKPFSIKGLSEKMKEILKK